LLAGIWNWSNCKLPGAGETLEIPKHTPMSRNLAINRLARFSFMGWHFTRTSTELTIQHSVERLPATMARKRQESGEHCDLKLARASRPGYTILASGRCLVGTVPPLRFTASIFCAS
jgi:hypothetical protein